MRQAINSKTGRAIFDEKKNKIKNQILIVLNKNAK